MTYAWSTWLLPALQADKFVADRIVVVKDWETRGRPPEQYSYLPSGLLDHHTACGIKIGHDPQWCVNGIIAGNSSAPGPISQLLGTFTPLGVKWDGKNLDPRIVIIAAGRSNHAGSGQWPWGAPSGNGSAIGIEWCGPPEGGWPDQVIELRLRVDAAILRRNGWGTHQVTTHWEYVQPVRPGAKNDPSNRWRAQLSLPNGSVNWGSAQWDPKIWRSELYKVVNPVTPPPPPPPPPLTGTYVVVTGDSWWGISRKVGIAVDKLVALNAPMTINTMLHPGMVLNIGAPTGISTPPAERVTPPGYPAIRWGSTDANTVMTGWPTGRVSWLQGIINVPETGTWDAASVAELKRLQGIAGIYQDGVYGNQSMNVFLVWRGF